MVKVQVKESVKSESVLSALSSLTTLIKENCNETELVNVHRNRYTIGFQWRMPTVKRGL